MLPSTEAISPLHSLKKNMQKESATEKPRCALTLQPLSHEKPSLSTAVSCSARHAFAQQRLGQLFRAPLAEQDMLLAITWTLPSPGLLLRGTCFSMGFQKRR